MPGCVHTDLFAAGKIADPFFRLNEKDQQWIEHDRLGVPDDVRSPTPRRSRASGSSWSSGARHLRRGVRQRRAVLSADNMFRSWRVDVKPQLTPATTRWSSASARRSRRSSRPTIALGYTLPAANDQAHGDGQHVDAQGALPLRLGLGAALRHQRHLAAGRRSRPGTGAPRRRAGLPARARRRARAAGGRRAVVGRARRARRSVDRRPAGRRVAGAATPSCKRAGATRSRSAVVIDKPERWWPNGLGAQKLYTLETDAGDAGGVTRATARRRASACARSRSCTGTTRTARASPSRSTARRSS